MDIIKTKLSGVYIIDNLPANDVRGIFCKTFHSEFFKDNNMADEYKESYYSISKKNSLRGMHFQLPPYHHEKLVYVPKGKIMDVVLDLRKNSETFGEYMCEILSGDNNKSMYIPKGCAHGFLALEDDSITIYNVTTVYSPESDTGVKWDSFGMNWGVNEPIISERDKSFVSFEDFISPF